MKHYLNNIEEETLNNHNFRKVLYTGPNLQLVLMCLKPGEDIGLEIHHDTDQFFRIERGECKVVIDGVEMEAGPEFGIVVPAGAEHNVINTSNSDELQVYTIYAPPHHPDGTVHVTKDDALAAEADH